MFADQSVRWSARLLYGLSVQSSSHFFYMRSVTANGFVELIARDAKLFRPVGDIGRQLWIDLLWIVRPFCVFFMYGVGLVCFLYIMVL
jgi:hypothetical protein